MKKNIVRIDQMQHEISSLRLEIEELREQKEDMKCCGNCEHFDGFGICYFKDNQKGMPAERYCKNWQFDGMTRKEREIRY